MRVNKTFVAIAVTAGVLGAGAVSSFAMADTADSTYPPIIDKIATKFNLNKDEVKKVFDEQRAEHQVEHKQKLEERLNQAVKDGKITEEQKTKLLAKLDELHTQRQEQKAENREQREAVREEFKKWADENGINLDEVMPKMEGRGGPRGGHGPF